MCVKKTVSYFVKKNFPENINTITLCYNNNRRIRIAFLTIEYAMQLTTTPTYFIKFYCRFVLVWTCGSLI